MSVPVLLPGSCCPLLETFHLPEPACRAWSRGQLLPGRPLLSLGLLQLLLGGSTVALCSGALTLSSSAAVRASCPLWAGSSVILSGVVGLSSWRKPVLLLVNVFVLLSVLCVLLNLTGFILSCQGAQLVSSMTSCQLAGDVCVCCSVSPSFSCLEDNQLQLNPALSCSTTRILLKKVLFALCALNALSVAVCLMAAALRYQHVCTRTRGMEEPGATGEEWEEPAPHPDMAQVMDPDVFVAPDPPPSYFSTVFSYTPRLARRMLGEGLIPLPHIYGTRIKDVEVFCPLDPPPPYELGSRSSSHTGVQETSQMDLNDAPTAEESPHFNHPPPPAVSRPPSTPPPPAVSSLPPSPPPALAPASPPAASPLQHSLALIPSRRIHRCSSDPVLMDLTTNVQSGAESPLAPSLQTADSSTQTSQPTLAPSLQAQVTLRQAARRPRPRPSSLVDYQSYRHTQQLVHRILKQPANQSLSPEVQELLHSIRLVLRSDQEHMEEAVRCASFIEQVFSDSENGQGRSLPNQEHSGYSPQTFPQPVRRTLAAPNPRTFPRPLRRKAGMLHLQSCGDLSSFTCAAIQSVENSGRRMAGQPGAGWRSEHPERPHSLVGVFRETVL